MAGIGEASFLSTTSGFSSIILNTLPAPTDAEIIWEYVGEYLGYRIH